MIWTANLEQLTSMDKKAEAEWGVVNLPKNWVKIDWGGEMIFINPAEKIVSFTTPFHFTDLLYMWKKFHKRPLKFDIESIKKLGLNIEELENKEREKFLEEMAQHMRQQKEFESQDHVNDLKIFAKWAKPDLTLWDINPKVNDIVSLLIQTCEAALKWRPKMGFSGDGSYQKWVLSVNDETIAETTQVSKKKSKNMAWDIAMRRLFPIMYNEWLEKHPKALDDIKNLSDDPPKQTPKSHKNNQKSSKKVKNKSKSSQNIRSNPPSPAEVKSISPPLSPSPYVSPNSFQTSPSCQTNPPLLPIASPALLSYPWLLDKFTPFTLLKHLSQFEQMPMFVIDSADPCRIEVDHEEKKYTGRGYGRDPGTRQERAAQEILAKLFENVKSWQELLEDIQEYTQEVKNGYTQEVENGYTQGDAEGSTHADMEWSTRVDMELSTHADIEWTTHWDVEMEDGEGTEVKPIDLD
jgi:hypothetical protein